jgi:hypothetical protein
MLRLTCLGLIVILSGCAGSSTTNLPGGGVGYRVTCSGNTSDDCRRKAQELCRQEGDDVTYEVVFETEDYSRNPTPRTMLVRCVRVVGTQPAEQSK